MFTTGAKWRIAVVAVLYILPFAVFTAIGMWFLNREGWGYVSWAGMFAFLLAAYTLTWYWTRKGSKAVLPNPTYDDPLNYWTDRDRTAWKVVEAHAASLQPPTVEQLNDAKYLTRYSNDAQELMLKVAQVYVPGTTDPLAHLTIPEILTMVELVSIDLSKLVDRFIPGSSLVTVGNLKQAKKAAKYYETARNIYWFVSAVMNPLKTAIQYASNRVGVQNTFQQIQNNLVHWFFLSFVHQIGRYLIELNSGRLRIGAKRYLELMAKHQIPPIGGEMPSAPPGAASPDEIEPETRWDQSSVTVALVGPVKAGKSSLVNAIFGETRAAVSQIPLTNSSTRYELNQADLPPLSIVDTVGFGVDGATELDIKNAMEAVRLADVAILVIPARSAARSPEVKFLERVRAAFLQQPHLRMPPVIVALSHIDQLTPAMEWDPPYDLAKGTRLKEQSIRDAISAAKEAFGKIVLDIVPICAGSGRTFNVQEELIPEIATLLGEARGVGLLRTLHLEGVINHTKKIAGQLYSAGKEIFKALWVGRQK